MADDFDPWESNPYGIHVMSPEEDAAWARFEDYMTQRYGYGWSVEIDTTPTPREREMRRAMEAMGRAAGQSMQELALGILTNGQD